MINASVRSSKSGKSESFSRNGSLKRIGSAGYSKDVFDHQNEDKLYKSIHQEYIILAEYKMVLSENIEGIYTIPSKENPFVWFGVIFVRSGLYEDGIFRFNIILPEHFPEGGHPKVIFLSELIHPVIHPNTNELHLLEGFPVWNRSEQHIWQILRYIHWIFYHFNASLAHTVNHDIANLYRNNEELYKQKVKSIVALSQQQIYEAPPTDDKHFLTLKKNVPENYEEIKMSMLAHSSKERTAVNGYSWVTQGSVKPLSRSPSTGSEK